MESASAKPASPTASLKAVSAALQKLRKTDAQLAALKELAASAGAKTFVQAAEATDALAAAVTNGAVRFAEFLLDAGVNPDARPDDAAHAHKVAGALVAATLTPDLSAKARKALIARLLEAGASVDIVFPDLRIINAHWIAETVSALDVAAVTGDLELARTLIPRVRDASVLASATAAIFRKTLDGVHRLPDVTVDAAGLKALLAAGLPAHGISRGGLPIAHAAALAAKPELLDVMLAADPALPTRTLEAIRPVPAPFGNEKLTLGMGATPLGAAEVLLAASRRTLAADAKLARWLEPQIAGLEANIARLAEAGGVASAGTVTLEAELRPLYDTLCTWLGAAVVDDALVRIDVKTATPFLFMLRIAATLPALTDKLAPFANDNVLAFLLDPKNKQTLEHVDELEGVDYSERRGIVAIDPEEFVESGRSILDSGRLITLRGEAVVSSSDTNGGNIWEIDAERAIDHGSVEALVADLRTRLDSGA